jgi:hypothetical protein
MVCNGGKWCSGSSGGGGVRRKGGRSVIVREWESHHPVFIQFI